MLELYTLLRITILWCELWDC